MKNKPLFTIFLIVFIDLLGFGIILPLLPYIAEKYHANGLQIGLLTATYSLFQFISTPILGRLSDRYGRKKLLLISQFGTFIGYLLLGIEGSLIILFVSRIIDGATGGNISIAQAYVADVTDVKSRAKGMGVLGAAFGIGFIFGPALGGFLSRFGFSAPAYFAAAVSLITMFATIFMLEETVDTKKERNDPRTAFSISVFLSVFKKQPIGGLIIIFFIINLSFSVMQGIFALWSQKKFGFGPTDNGYLFAFVGIVAVITQLRLLPMLLKRFSEVSIFKVGLLSMCIGLLLIPLSVHIVMIYLAVVFIAFGNGLVNPTTNSIASENIPKEEYGATMGLIQSSGSMGRIAGPVVGGESFVSISASAPFIISGTVAFLAFLFSLNTLKESKVRS